MVEAVAGMWRAIVRGSGVKTGLGGDKKRLPEGWLHSTSGSAPRLKTAAFLGVEVAPFYNKIPDATEVTIPLPANPVN